MVKVHKDGPDPFIKIVYHEIGRGDEVSDLTDWNSLKYTIYPELSVPSFIKNTLEERSPLYKMDSYIALNF